MEPAYKLLTVEEFLDACPDDRRRYQLFDGIIVAMAPPATSHQLIAATLTIEIGLAVRTNLPGCSVRSQAGIAPHGVLGRDHFETERIPSLREILYVETEQVGAMVYRRGDASNWFTIAVAATDPLRLETIGLDIPLSDLYRSIPGL
jgi:Uma2 family endonuclease